MLDVNAVLKWSGWIPHRGCWLGSKLPKEPGLYRIRRIGLEPLDYLGETGRSLKGRLRAQDGVYADLMPFNDPHTAAPALWALRQESGCEFEVSVTILKLPKQERRAYESLAIAAHRQSYGHSPTVGMSRMPLGWSKSSATKDQFRGGRTDHPTAHHKPGISPIGDLGGDCTSSAWGGHQWSDWQPLAAIRKHVASGEKGLYRIRAVNSLQLVYIGQGVLSARLTDHCKNAAKPNDRKYAALAACGELEASWVSNNAWNTTQREELEHDLIGSHLLALSSVPVAQFGGPDSQEKT